MKCITRKIFTAISLAAVMIACGGSGRQDGGAAMTLDVEEFAKVIKRKDVRLIDVRTPKEFAEEHLQGAENLDVNAADFATKTEDVKGKVAVYCRSGKRSRKAANQLTARGCTVYELRGGIMAWKLAGQPTVR